MWHYRAKVVKVIDGDTLDVSCDLGFSIYHTVRLRLARIDAPEMSTPEGKALKLELQQMLPDATVVEITTGKGDRYGRWIAEVVLQNGINLSDHLLEQNKAAPYL